VQVSSGRFEPSWSKRFALVQWVVSGLVQVTTAGRRAVAAPGDVAIYLPSAPLDFRAIHDINELCWFTVDGPLCEQFLHQLGLHPGVFHVGPAPIDRIHDMIRTLDDPSPQAHRRASLLAIETLWNLADCIVTPDLPGVVLKAQRFIDQHFDDPDLSASHLADTLDYHPGSLSRLFHKHTGITVIEYITQVRLRHAKSLLQHTEEKVSVIARQCGFHETTYFCRWLRKHAGVTARHLRAAS
jgi:AraC-like DNA-binding protein